MQSIIDVIQGLARQRSRGESGPLVLLRQLDGSVGERISHLPVDTELAHAWLAQSGEPFRPHQAQSLMALRRTEPVALCADNPTVAQSTALLIYALLHGQAGSTALVVAADALVAQTTLRLLERIVPNMPQQLRLPPALVASGVRPDPRARVLVVTPDLLHERLLRHHDRAWRLFWSRLRLMVLAEPQRVGGVGGAHLADLLLRSRRVALANGAQTPALLVTLPNVADPQPALTLLHGQNWRVIRADDMPFEPSTLAVWDSAADRLREAADLAIQLHRQGYRVHLSCEALELPALTPIIGDLKGITVGPEHVPAQALILTGYQGASTMLARQLRAGYQAVVVVLGGRPHEQMLARHTQLLLSNQPPAWLPPPLNVYAAAQHVLAAATELPLTLDEVQAWNVQEIVERLVAHEQLVDLPDPEIAWKPTSAAGDPYVDFSMLSSSGPALSALGEQGQEITRLDPSGFERWTFPNAALPPGGSGLRVVRRDDDYVAAVLRLESGGRRTYPMRRCTVTPRETHETRRVFSTRPVSWGRVLLEEETYGYRELSGPGPATELALKPPIQARWSAPACWFELHTELHVTGQFVGWCLAAALPLRAFVRMVDLVPCYDQATRRLYLVDAQPGGSELAHWLYEHAEDLLPLAYDIALACRNDPLLEPLARVEMDWLLALLGRGGEAPAERASAAPAVRPPLELVPAPTPLEPPKIEFIPAPEPPARPLPAGERPERVALPRANDRLMEDLLAQSLGRARPEEPAAPEEPLAGGRSARRPLVSPAEAAQSSRPAASARPGAGVRDSGFSPARGRAEPPTALPPAARQPAPAPEPGAPRPRAPQPAEAGPAPEPAPPRRRVSDPDPEPLGKHSAASALDPEPRQRVSAPEPAPLRQRSAAREPEPGPPAQPEPEVPRQHALLSEPEQQPEPASPQRRAPEAAPPRRGDTRPIKPNRQPEARRAEEPPAHAAAPPPESASAPPAPELRRPSEARERPAPHTHSPGGAPQRSETGSGRHAPQRQHTTNGRQAPPRTEAAGGNQAPRAETPGRPAPAPASPGRNTPQPPQTPPAEEGPPDPRGMIERLRRQRQEREAQRAAPAAPRERAAAPGAPAPELRFAAGDRVYCLPYGEGLVRASRLDDGREMLEIDFPSYGELTVDPSVSFVRKKDPEQTIDDDLI